MIKKEELIIGNKEELSEYITKELKKKNNTTYLGKNYGNEITVENTKKDLEHWLKVKKDDSKFTYYPFLVKTKEEEESGMNLEMKGMFIFVSSINEAEFEEKIKSI